MRQISTAKSLLCNYVVLNIGMQVISPLGNVRIRP